MMYKAIVIFICAILFTVQLFSEVTRRENSRRGKIVKVEALTNKVAGFDVQASTRLSIRQRHKYVFSTKGNMGRCIGKSQYFTSDGGLGVKGRVLEQELTGRGLSTPMKHLYFRNTFPGMENLCPKFNSFNDNQKLNFWIWYFASIANTESECGRNGYNPVDVNGVSAGELQLPEAWKHRKWRGVRSGAGGCNAQEGAQSVPSHSYRSVPALKMGSQTNNLRCGVEILSGVLCGFYRNPTERCNSTTTRPYGNGFWAKIRTGINGAIPKNIKRFPLCK